MQPLALPARPLLPVLRGERGLWLRVLSSQRSRPHQSPCHWSERRVVRLAREGRFSHGAQNVCLPGARGVPSNRLRMDSNWQAFIRSVFQSNLHESAKVPCPSRTLQTPRKTKQNKTKQNKTKRGNATRPVGLGPGQLRPGECGAWFYQRPVPPAEKRGSRQKAQATQGRGPRLSPGKWNLFHRKQRSALRWGQNRFTKRGVHTDGCVLLCEPMVKENFYLIAHSFCSNGQETTKAKTRQGPKG